jgi:hypothetical protein
VAELVDVLSHGPCGVALMWVTAAWSALAASLPELLGSSPDETASLDP